ncbi:hypothetical protein CUMW_185440 [Citrus unshiu]|nr:hypothetical protein CUMW_185440 [Citrus unshiu]
MLTISTQTLPSITLSLQRHVSFFPHVTTVRTPRSYHFLSAPLSSAASQSTFVEQLAGEKDSSQEEKWDMFKNSDAESGSVDFDVGAAGSEMRHLDEPVVEVIELEELPEQWRRAKLAWLCKELPSHKGGTLVRILNAQKKWLRQEDGTYLAVHCMRIRENETGFRVYEWMMQQHWYRFDFALATKLADYMGKERKFAKCREIFDDIINQGRVPSEMTFHILIVAYLSAPVQGCLDEACSIYNRMIQLGGYQPRPSLHNSLFRALVSKPGGLSKYYLQQAEFIFHNLLTSGLEIQKDIYSGLIWLHSYQDNIDKERISLLKKEMQQAGFEEGKEVLLSVLRVCAKEGDVEDAEKTWLRLLESDNGIPTPTFVYKMEAYAKIGEFMKSLEIFREMQERLGSASVPAYHKIIELLCKAEETELAESLMKEFVETGMKPLMPSYINLTNMYLNLGMHNRKEVKKPVSLNLSSEQRENLIGLLLGGLCIESDEKRKRHMIRFQFNENSRMHSVLRRYLYDQYHEWLHPSFKVSDGSDDIPYKYSTISHPYFCFYADKFWPKGRLVIPKLIHRWLTPRALAYWFMYGGHRTSVGDILLKLKVSSEGIALVFKTLKARSLDCRVKKKGRVFWIGFLGSNSTLFWKLIEPYVLDELKLDTQNINFDCGSDSDEKASDYSDDD